MARATGPHGYHVNTWMITYWGTALVCAHQQPLLLHLALCAFTKSSFEKPWWSSAMNRSVFCALTMDPKALRYHVKEPSLNRSLHNPGKTPSQHIPPCPHFNPSQQSGLISDNIILYTVHTYRLQPWRALSGEVSIAIPRTHQPRCVGKMEATFADRLTELIVGSSKLSLHHVGRWCTVYPIPENRKHEHTQAEITRSPIPQGDEDTGKIERFKESWRGATRSSFTEIEHGGGEKIVWILRRMEAQRTFFNRS